VSSIYIYIIGLLGFLVKDDYFILTFPSWPFLINCFEGCGYRIVIALVSNGILVGGIIQGFASLLSRLLVRKKGDKEKS
jgi:hypothetical protein